MNLPRASSFCLWAIAAVAAAGADQARPLEESTKELKKLEAGPAATGAPTARESLKGVVLPALQTPTDSAPGFQRLTPQQSERERQQRNDAQRNWLLNGMAKLQRESEEKGLLPGGAGPESGVEDLPLDTSDPAYLLKLYEKQRKSGATKTAEVRALRMPQADPFAPFLQGWLAGSPLKDQMWSESLRTNGAAGGKPGMESGSSASLSGGGTTSMAVSGGVAPDPGPAAGNPNPYLAGPDASAMGNPVALSPPSRPTGLPVPPAAARIGPGMTRETGATPNDRKPLPPPLADEKKYFPQLKKF